MKIQLKSLALRNFKGIREFKASFDHVTNIYGRNEAGKTNNYAEYNNVINNHIPAFLHFRSMGRKTKTKTNGKRARTRV